MATTADHLADPELLQTEWDLSPLVDGEDEAPEATDAQRGWREVLIAATLQGAIFGLVKAAVDRGAAEGARKYFGIWPGDDPAADAE